MTFTISYFANEHESILLMQCTESYLILHNLTYSHLITLRLVD